MEMKQCLCGCGEPVSEKATFRVGHDARYKSQLIGLVLDSDDQEAMAILESRGWIKFLDKARNNKSRKRVTREQAEKDGLPMNAVRITAEMDEDTVAAMIVNRKIVIRATIRGQEHEEAIEVGRIRCVAEGEIDFWVKDYTKQGVPLTNQCRTVRADSIVGILNK